MGKPKVSDITKILDALYRPDLAQEWDVNGLNLGSSHKPVSKILFTVDLTKAVVEEAISENVDLIISHHPLILHPVSLLPEESQKGEIVSKLIKNDIALINAHTNADAAARGVNDALAHLLNVSDLKPINETGIGRFGTLAKPMKLKDFGEFAKEKLPKTKNSILISGDLEKEISTVAVCGGAGDSLLSEVRELALDVYLTADLRHHPAQDNKELAGPALISVSHWASEWPWLNFCLTDLNRELENAGFEVEMKISTLNTDPWDAAL